MPDDPAQRRHIYIIDKEFQYRFVATWLLMTLGYILIVLGVLYWAGNVLHNKGLDEISTLELASLLRYLGLFVVLLTIFLGLYLLLLSHRVAGPAYRLVRSLERMRAGDFDFSVVLREKDYLQDVADQMNALIRDLQGRQAATEGAADELDAAITGLRAEGGDPTVLSQLETIEKTLRGETLRRDTIGTDSQIEVREEPAGEG